jgi:hypothetical protein
MALVDYVFMGSAYPEILYVPLLTLSGIATMGQGLIKDFGGIVGMRFVLGIFEAGLFPGKSTSIDSR